jgi:hypothetical protein
MNKKNTSKEADLEATLGELRVYRKREPNFEGAIADYIDAEASLKEDPAEGQRTDTGPAQTRILEDG